MKYCYSPKHTVGEQLLDVRRDKRERAAFAEEEKKKSGTGEDDEEEIENQDEYVAADGRVSSERGRTYEQNSSGRGD